MDIFDKITDVFERMESEDSSVESIKKQLSTVLEKFDAKERKKENGKITEEIKSFVKTELSKIKPVQNVIEKTREIQVQVPLHVQPRIIQTESSPKIIERIIREVPKKDDKKYAEEKSVSDLKKEIEELQSALENIKQVIPLMGARGGSGVMGIPPPEGNETKVLTVKNNKASWQTATGGSGGGSSSDAYTPSNVTTDRSYDANSTSIDELADVLGSLIVSLQGAGIIQ